MQKKPGSLLALIMLICIGLFGQFSSVYGQKSFEVSKEFEIFHSLYRELDQFYVDSISPEKALKNGIDGLMSSYDPYTNYIPESEAEDFKFLTTGEYGGIGAVIGVRDGKVLILELYQNMPAQKSGLLVGDELLQIDNEKLTAENNSKASDFLKGQPGTQLKVVIKREGIKKPITKLIQRELVKITPVPYYGLVGEKTGYINLNGFTDKATQEMMHALTEVKKQGADKLIIDLRSNGGGLLNEAVSICNLFIGKGQVIVSTKGKVHQWDQIYKTTREPVDSVMPIVILVNSGSASSSEIVCGAMQDLDRAVILGTRTFGKGLVQTTRSIPYNGVLKVTTAKYYTPSGRCIQAINYSNRNEDGSVGRIPDSLTTEFATRAGRKVRDGGGIKPDIECKDERGSAISYNLVKGMYFFDYANKYYREHGTIPPVQDFKLSDEEYGKFVDFVKGKGFTYEKNSLKIMAQLKDMLEQERILDGVKDDFTSLENKINKDNIDNDFKTFRPEIEMLLGSEIISRYYFQAGEVQQSLKYDPCLKEAIRVLNDGKLYKETLGVK